MTVEVFQDGNSNVLNKNIWSTVYHNGQCLRFGDPSEIKYAKWLTSNIVLEGEALEAINRGEMPDGWEFKGSMVRAYKEQFENRDMWKGFIYTYAQRLLECEIPNPAYPKTFFSMIGYVFKNFRLPPQTITVNQLDHMREQLKEAFGTGIQSTRIIATTFQQWKDWGQSDIPCFLVVQLFPLPGNLVEAHYLFRSHDLANGWGANLYGLNNFFIERVIKPAGGTLSKVVCTSWVAHLYDTDESMYMKVVET